MFNITILTDHHYLLMHRLLCNSYVAKLIAL